MVMKSTANILVTSIILLPRNNLSLVDRFQLVYRLLFDPYE